MTRVGHTLYRQVRDLAPASWTSGMRVVAWCIADAAGENSRRTRKYTQADLCKQAGMTPDGVRRALRKLAEEGYEFRVEHGRDKAGNPVYATPVQDVEYQVPAIFGHMINGAAVSLGLVDNRPAGKTTVLP